MINQSEELQYYQKVVRKLELPLKKNLKVLDISGLKLKSLDFLQDQEDLEILVAENNELTNECFKDIAKLKNLKILSLQDNKIKNHQNIELLADLPLLELRLLFNEIAQLPQYYRKVYNMLPNLFSLDDFDRDGLQIYDLFK